MENPKTALDSSYNHSSNISYPDSEIHDYSNDLEDKEHLFCWLYKDERGDLLSKIVIGIFFPMSLLAIYSLYSQIRSERFVPVFIINLLISDILQVACMAVNLTYDKLPYTNRTYITPTYYGFVAASLLFMTLIALERYLMIAHPMWYRFNKTTKVSVLVSVVNWIFSVLLGFSIGRNIGASLLIPLPFMIFSLVGTFRALSAAQSVPAAEKRRIVAVLVVVVLIYIVMFLPMVLGISFLLYAESFNYDELHSALDRFSCTLFQISPLTDIFLYIFLKKWFIDKLLTSLCCCIRDSDEAQQTVDETGSSTSESKDHECP